MCRGTCCNWAWTPDLRAEAQGGCLRIEMNGAYLLPARPDDALVFLGHRRQAFIHEALHALAAISFGGVDVALRIHGDAMHTVELPGLPSALTKSRQNFERLPVENVNPVILAI